jgi:intein/homing endonuclease
VEGTLITVGEYSIPIELLSDSSLELLSYDETNNGLSYNRQTNFFNQGIKECLELTFEDGTILQCTPDHKILLENNIWCEAQNIELHNDKVCCGYSPPVYKIENNQLVIGDFVFTGEKIIIFYKILGYVCTDSLITHNRTKIYFGHQIDGENMVRDINKLCSNSTIVHNEHYGWSITILGKLGEMFRNIPGVLQGPKVSQKRTLPQLLESAEEGELCAFLSGFYGGDGCTLSFRKKAGSLGSIGFAWTSNCEENLIDCFELIKRYLLKCNINSTLSKNKRKYDIDKIGYFLHVNASDLQIFKEKINFSYCVHKSMRLEAAYSYHKLRDKVWEQQNWLISKVREMKKQKTIEEATNEAIDELYENFPIYNKYYSKPTRNQMVEFLRPRKKLDKPMFSYSHFPSPMEHIENIGCKDFFDSYAIDRTKTILPVLYKKVIHIKNIGNKKVYDLEVDKVHNFIANGIIVHNCQHDPKVIRKLDLTKYIEKEKDKIKQLRDKRNKTIDKLRKKELMEEIDKQVEDLKPYIEERSEITKTINKNVTCTKRRYRFLKEPRGVLPTVIQNLLDARKHTRKVDMKKCEKEIERLEKDMEENGNDNNVLIQSQKTFLDVLDKRQLAYKIASNSMYGALGVRRGYLPLMPAAMCVTYMGRKNIEIVAKTIPEKYGGELVYGDQLVSKRERKSVSP